MPILAHYLYIDKKSHDLQSGQTGEALEDVYVETADAVIGQVSAAQNRKRKFLVYFFHVSEITWQLQWSESLSISKSYIKAGSVLQQEKPWKSDCIMIKTVKRKNV